LDACKQGLENASKAPLRPCKQGKHSTENRILTIHNSITTNNLQSIMLTRKQSVNHFQQERFLKKENFKILLSEGITCSMFIPEVGRIVKGWRSLMRPNGGA
jgi:hypothetical protein